MGAGSSSGRAAPTVLRGFRSELWAERRKERTVKKSTTPSTEDEKIVIKCVDVEPDEQEQLEKDWVVVKQEVTKDGEKFSTDIKQEVKKDEAILSTGVKQEVDIDEAMDENQEKKMEETLSPKPEEIPNKDKEKTIQSGKADTKRTLYASSLSEHRYRSYAKFDFNINAHHGGCTSLLFVANGNSELHLVRSGFDCNHFETKMISKVTENDFGDIDTVRLCDVKGTFICDQIFENNINMLLTNDYRNDDLQIGVFFEMGENESSVRLPIDIKQETHGKDSSVGIVLSSAVSDGTPLHSVHLLMTEANTLHAKCISGNEDSFTYESTAEGDVILRGPTGSHFALFNTKDVFTSEYKRACVSHHMSVDGTEKEMLIEKLEDHATILVLCSNSNGTENSTASSVYKVSVANGKLVQVEEIAGCYGSTYDSSDLWSFDVKSGQLWVSYPSGPSRIAILSNMPYIKGENSATNHQTGCIATGEKCCTTESVNCALSTVDGTVNKISEIIVMVNHRIVRKIPTNDLGRQGDEFKFSSDISEETKEYGQYLVRVFAVRKNVKNSSEQFIELTGSPKFVVKQKPGVIYALNCFGPAYHSLEDIVYADDLEVNGNFDSKINFGERYVCNGMEVVLADLHGSIQRTEDGFLYGTARQAENLNEFDHRFTYTVKDLPNGTFKLRLHMVDEVKKLELNGERICDEVNKKIEQLRKPSDLPRKAAYPVELDVTIKDNTITLHATHTNAEVWKHTDKICAFDLLDKTFEAKEKTDEQLKEEEKEKERLADEVIPIDTAATRKTITIVGWSQNLLKNASGENGDMKYWNTSGDICVLKGQKAGYGTEACFSTSLMWSSKNQEVNLLDFFTAEYLDTAPDIQVSEMYKMHRCKGGYYKFEVQLLSEDGKVIKEYSTGEIGILTNEDWEEASVTFSDYGPGARIVSFTSQGKDSRYWSGYFGPYISAAALRVRREKKNRKRRCVCRYRKDDSTQRADLDKLVNKVLSDNAVLLKDFIEDDNVPVDKDFERQTTDVIETFKSKGSKRRTHKKREIRVFVSSTFRDFTMEREEIIKKAFREINRICVDRGVFFTYVDLRWGITSEQTKDGKTILICLREIDRCRPYFICLMGDRFGWCQQEEKKDELLNMTFDYAIENNPDFKWVDNYRYDASVTQLEILHGVLNNPTAVKDTCFFYMRDPPKEHEVSPDLYKRMISESEWHKHRQDTLKEMVKKHPEIKISKFKTAVEVSELIKRDLEHCVDVAFPKGTELTKLEQQRESHDAFASVRCQVYIGRQEYFTEINKQRENRINKPFVLLGESGSGKSALVANWVKQVETAEPETFVFVHFIGSSADSAHYIKMIRRLFEEIKTYFHFDLPIPSSDSILIRELGQWLRMAGSLTKVVIVFDAVNQLDDGSGEIEGPEHDLKWIPSEIPNNVFILVSTLPGRAMNACKDEGWPSMNVEPLKEDQKMEIITDYLEGIYRKSLTIEQKQMIVKEKQTSNPLYLKSLLDEVRMYGSFRTLTNKISEYLSANTPQELFGKILDRLEDDFEKGEMGRKGIVKDTTTALWCSNKGMSEAELKEILDVTSAIWSPFYMSLIENLVNRNGILNFFHDHLRQAVERKYLPTKEAKQSIYLKLADFHSSKEISSRTIEELPFLLTNAGELERLKEVVTNLKVFYKLSSEEDGIFELIKAWKTLGGFALSEDAYMSKIEGIPRTDIEANPTYYCELYSRLGSFFLRMGIVNAARKVYETLIKQLESNYGEEYGTVVYNTHDRSYKYRCKHPEVIKGLHELGTVYSKLGQYKKASDVYEDAMYRQNRIITPSQKLQLCEGMLGLAAVRIQLEEMMEAKMMMAKALELATFVLGKKHHYVATIFSRLGQLAYKQSRLDEALAYYLQDLKVTRSEVGTNHPRTAIVLNEIGLVYDDKNDNLAGKLYEAALSIILDTYGNDYLGTGNIRFNLGAFYFGTNYFSKALYQFTESYKIHRLFLGDDHLDTLAVKKALDSVTKMMSTDDEM